MFLKEKTKVRDHSGDEQEDFCIVLWHFLVRALQEMGRIHKFFPLTVKRRGFLK